VLLKKIDIYIIIRYLTTFFFALLLFSVVSVIIDLTEKVDSLIEHGITVKQTIFDYYLNFIPYIDALLTPLFVFISVIFFTSKLASNTELIAMWSGGISTYRILIPYLIATAFIASLLLYFNHYVVPDANKKRQAFEYTYLSNKAIMKIKRTIQLQLQKGVFVYVDNYTHSDTVGYKFSYEVIRENQLLYKLKADRISWISEEQKWRLNNYVARKFDRNKEIISNGTVLDTSLGFFPNEFDVRVSIKEEMQTPELIKHIEKLRLNGYEFLADYEFEYHRRSADAFMTFILMLMGYSIASRKTRGGIGLHIVAGFALSAIYIIFQQFTKTFATNADLPAFWGVWIPNICFSIISLIMLRKSQQ
jgi:lipopolysaccharide export system permease protein